MWVCDELAGVGVSELHIHSMLICAGTVAVDTCLSIHMYLYVLKQQCGLIQKHTSQKSHCLLAFINPSNY